MYIYIHTNFQIELKEKYPQRRLRASKNEQNLNQNTPEKKKECAEPRLEIIELHQRIFE